MRVKFEKMKKSAIIQCYRCQRFSHTAGQCAFKYRCVQCIDSHAPGSCPRKNNNKIPVRCINCHTAGIKNDNHSANNLGCCEFFKDNHQQLHQKFTANGDRKTKSSVKVSNTQQKSTKTSHQSSNANDIFDNARANNPTANSTGNKNKKKKKSGGKNKNKTDVSTNSKSNVNSGKSDSELASIVNKLKPHHIGALKALFELISQIK